MDTKEAERDNLHKDLIKLGDMMGDGLHYEEPWIAKEYRRIAKLLYPEMFPAKKRKPSQRWIKTLKECDCGQTGWHYVTYRNGSVELKCKNCGRSTGECKNNSDARDKWNASFNIT